MRHANDIAVVVIFEGFELDGADAHAAQPVVEGLDVEAAGPASRARDMALAQQVADGIVSIALRIVAEGTLIVGMGAEVEWRAVGELFVPRAGGPAGMLASARCGEAIERVIGELLNRLDTLAGV